MTVHDFPFTSTVIKCFLCSPFRLYLFCYFQHGIPLLIPKTVFFSLSVRVMEKDLSVVIFFLLEFESLI